MHHCKALIFSSMGKSQSRSNWNRAEAEQQSQLQISQAFSSSGDEYDEFEIIRPVVVTGFGRVYPEETDRKNFSWRAVEKLGEIITDYQGNTIPVIKAPQDSPGPVKVCYRSVEEESFQDWLVSTDALVYLHLGISSDKGNRIRLETTARRDVDFEPDKYPYDDTPSNPGWTWLYPPLDSVYELQTSFELDTLSFSLNDKFESGIQPKGCGKNPIKLSFEVSNDAGKNLCDFLYYESLKLADKRKSFDPNFPRKVLFVHIPDVLCFPEDDEFKCPKTTESMLSSSS